MTEGSAHNRFFPIGTKCPQCKYALEAVTDVCPECGMPIEMLSANGTIEDLIPETADKFPIPLHPRPDRYIDLVLHSRVYDFFGKFLIIGLLLWILAVFILTRFEYKPAYETPTLIRLFLLSQIIGIPASIIGATLYAELLSYFHRRAQAKGLELGKLERYCFTVTRSLIIERDGESWLLLLTNWYGSRLIYFFPPEEIERLAIDLDQPIGKDAEILINPLSRACAEFKAHGEPAPTRRTSSVRLRYLASKLHRVKGAPDEWVFLRRRKSKGSYFTSD